MGISKSRCAVENRRDPLSKVAEADKNRTFNSHNVSEYKIDSQMNTWVYPPWKIHPMNVRDSLPRRSRLIHFEAVGIIWSKIGFHSVEKEPSKVLTEEQTNTWGSFTARRGFAEARQARTHETVVHDFFHLLVQTCEMGKIQTMDPVAFSLCCSRLLQMLVRKSRFIHA